MEKNKNILTKIIILAASVSLILAGCGNNSGADTGSSSVSGETSAASSVAGESAENEESVTSEASSEASSDESAEVSAVSVDNANASTLFTERDLSGDYDESEAVYITLSGSSASCDLSSVTISEGYVTISEEGVYVLSGSFEGTVCVDAGESKVQLVLNGVSITSADYAAIYIVSADKVFVTLASGTENSLSNGGEWTQTDGNNVDGVIFSKDDLVINGAGSLSITSEAGHGIVSKDDLKLCGGTVSVVSESSAISANDSIRVYDVSLTVESGADGLKAENTDDSESGYVYILGGSFDITGTGDAISASYFAKIDGGTFNITAGGGAGSVSEDENGDWNWQMPGGGAGGGTGGGQPGGMGGGRMDSLSASLTDTGSATSGSTGTSVSAKAIKATSALYINGGSFTIDSADDALHSNGDIVINGGTFEIKTGDDGTHADESLTINDCTMNIADCYEGLEALLITVNGGDIDITASDDGMNAAGGNDSSGQGGFFGGGDFANSSGSGDLYINGGSVYINASGDGIDSNGTLTVTGGELYIDGPSDSANGALDYQTSAVISGGTVIAVGASGMAEGFGSSSTQCSALISLQTQEAGSEITLTDSSGNVLASMTSAKSFSSVFISCPDMAEGETYTLSAGSQSVTIEMDGTVYSGSGGMGGGSMSMPGGSPGRKDSSSVN